MGIIKEQYYKIYLDGKELSKYFMDLIRNVILEDRASGSDILHIEMADPDFRLISDSLFVEDKAVTFEGGWRNEKPVTFSGFISVIDVSFPENGTPSITLHCMDNSHVLNRSKKKRTWENLRASAVAKSVFAEHGLTPVVDTTSIVEENISQSNNTDIAFLINLAKDQEEDYLCYVEGTKGYFVKKDILKSPQKELEYRTGKGDLISFSPRINKESKQEKVDNSDVDTDTGKVVEDKGTNSDTRDLQGQNTKTYTNLHGTVWRENP